MSTSELEQTIKELETEIEHKDQEIQVLQDEIDDFEEAYKYGVKLSLDELLKFDKLLDKIEKEQGKDSDIVQWLTKIREQLT